MTGRFYDRLLPCLPREVADIHLFSELMCWTSTLGLSFISVGNGGSHEHTGDQNDYEVHLEHGHGDVRWSMSQQPWRSCAKPTPVLLKKQVPVLEELHGLPYPFHAHSTVSFLY